MVLKILAGIVAAVGLYEVLSNVFVYMFWQRRDNLTLEDQERVGDAVRADWPFGRPQ